MTSEGSNKKSAHGEFDIYFFVRYHFWQKFLVSIGCSSVFTFFLTWYHTKGDIMRIEEGEILFEAFIFFILCFVLSFLMAMMMSIRHIIQKSQADAIQRWKMLDNNDAHQQK